MSCCSSTLSCRYQFKILFRRSYPTFKDYMYIYFLINLIYKYHVVNIMTTLNKRKDTMPDDKTPKRVKKECSYGEGCYRRNPAHFREFSHAHLEAILDSRRGDEEFTIPAHLSMSRHMILEQLEVIVEKGLYVPKKDEESSTSSNTQQSNTSVSKEKTKEEVKKIINVEPTHSSEAVKRENSKSPANIKAEEDSRSSKEDRKTPTHSRVIELEKKSSSNQPTGSRERSSDYRPIVPPTRRAQDYLKVVRPTGKMAAKHAASAPYHIFYTTITDSRETHTQPYSITFQEILDSSLGELKCSLQINFMVEIAWLLAQYYFAGYSEKRLTIVYGEDSPDMKTISQKKPHVDAHHVSMPTPFGTHHTKMMILCYEDGSLRVVISTANLYYDDWENRTQGLWFSPRCPELPVDAMPHAGDSPTQFKKYLLRYLNHYHMPQLSYYVERVKRCDFSHINVFLIASAPGSHFDTDWGLTRVGSLLRQHCCIPAEETRQWPLVAQASSLGSFGKEPKVWLTGDFLNNFAKIKNQSQMLSTPPELKLIYPSLENVRQSHDGLLGGGCLPYGASSHSKQPWLNNFLYQWKATSTARNRAMPHIKSYTRISKDAKMAAFYLLTSGNTSKAAWGSINKGNAALRIMSYEAGVLLLPRFIINEDYFPLEESSRNRLVLAYDVPPTKYTEDTSPWVMDYLH